MGVGCVRCGLATMRHLGWPSRSTASGTLNTISPLQLNGSKDKIRQVNFFKKKIIIQVGVPAALNVTQCWDRSSLSRECRFTIWTILTSLSALSFWKLWRCLPDRPTSSSSKTRSMLSCFESSAVSSSRRYILLSFYAFFFQDRSAFLSSVLSFPKFCELLAQNPNKLIPSFQISIVMSTQLGFRANWDCREMIGFSSFDVFRPCVKVKILTRAVQREMLRLSKKFPVSDIDTRMKVPWLCAHARLKTVSYSLDCA